MSAERELESIRRNVQDIVDAIGDQSIVDGQRVKRLLQSTLPPKPLKGTWRSTHRGYCHPRCYSHDADGECLITDDYGAI